VLTMRHRSTWLGDVHGSRTGPGAASCRRCRRRRLRRGRCRRRRSGRPRRPRRPAVDPTPCRRTRNRRGTPFASWSAPDCACMVCRGCRAPRPSSVPRARSAPSSSISRQPTGLAAGHRSSQPGGARDAGAGHRLQQVLMRTVRGWLRPRRSRPARCRATPPRGSRGRRRCLTWPSGSTSCGRTRDRDGAAAPAGVGGRRDAAGPNGPGSSP
jgi:hypothetical protein